MKYLLILLLLPSCITIYVTEPKKGYWTMSGCASGGEFGTMDTMSLKIKTPSVSISNAGPAIVDNVINSDSTIREFLPNITYPIHYIKNSK